MKDYLPAVINPLPEKTVYEMNPVVLAFVGDSVQQLYVRTKLSAGSTMKSGELHKLAVKEVRAVSQADFAHRLLPALLPREKDVFMRARNSKTNSPAKHASIADYKAATGFEAVIGYLYLSGGHERLLALLEVGNEDNNDD
ncbi:MAG TPA: Mini-ribonuclease 3 [Candidatus Faecicola pullistercoris]|nr:Mini-ribonuclease 3 [Candidatus Faecicola pullistercoris]